MSFTNLKVYCNITGLCETCWLQCRSLCSSCKSRLHKGFFVCHSKTISKFTWFIIFQIAAGPGLQIFHTYMTHMTVWLFHVSRISFIATYCWKQKEDNWDLLLRINHV